MACVSRWRVCPAGCCCGGFAADALLAWLCRLDLGWVLGRVDVLRIRRTSPLFFPLQTIAPSLRGLPAPAGWGSHNPRTVFLYAPVLAIIWGDFGILEYPHGPFRRNAACFFLYAPVLVTIWGDFGISEYPHGPFRRKQKGGQSGCNASRGLLMHGQHRAVSPVRVCRDRLYTHGAACITAVMPSEGACRCSPGTVYKQGLTSL